MSWEVADHRGLAGLEALERDWRDLYQAMPVKSRYHSYDAHLAFARNLCKAPDLSRYVTLSEGGKVRAICPLMGGQDTSLGIKINAWTLPVHPHWPIGDVVCADDDARQALLPAILKLLRERPEGRPLLMLGPLPERSTLWGPLAELKSADFHTHDAAASRVFDCTVSYEELMSRLTKHFRRNVRAHRKKLDSLEEVRFSTESGEQLWSGPFDAFLAVEASGWKGSGGTESAIRLHEHLTAYYRQLATSMTGPEDRCEINSLHADGRCIAAQFCLKTGAEYTIMKIGFEEAYAWLGPGQLLLDNTLRKCCEDEGIARLDLVSDSSWIRDWQAEPVPMKQAHMAVSTFVARPLMPLLDFRYGPARGALNRFREATGHRYGRTVRAKRRRAEAARTPHGSS